MTSAETLILIGRVILGLFFVIAGVRNFLNLPKNRTPQTNYGWKLPTSIVVLGFAAQLIGGLSITLGILTPWGASLIILFLIGATELFHNFLMFKGEARLPHLYLTLVNCALVGYCLLVIGVSI